MIKLAPRDCKYLLANLSLTKEVTAVLQNSIRSSRKIVIDEDTAIYLRELCSDRLSLVGFDINYEPNSDGIILEDLIDKLFTD